MKIHQIFTNSPYRNFSYVIEYMNSESGIPEAICIDPYYPKQILDFAAGNGLKLVSIVNTHEHNDHTCGNEEVKMSTGCEIWAHEHALGKIDNVDVYLKTGDEIQLDKDSYMQVMYTPGHTFAHLCLLVYEKGKPTAIITGDTLFNAGVGNCHNGGDPEALYETMSSQFSELPGDVVVYPGHDYWQNNLGFCESVEVNNNKIYELRELYENYRKKDAFLVSDIALERAVNVFFRLNEPEVQYSVDEVDEKEVFLKLRGLRDHW